MSRSGNEPMQVERSSRKGAYPYRYMNTFNRFDATRLPPRAAFYNDLDETSIYEKDYLHAETVWNVLKIENLGE